MEYRIKWDILHNLYAGLDRMLQNKNGKLTFVLNILNCHFPVVSRGILIIMFYLTIYCIGCILCTMHKTMLLTLFHIYTIGVIVMSWKFWPFTLRLSPIGSLWWACSPWVWYIVGPRPSWVELRTFILIVSASPLKLQLSGARTKTGWL